MVHSFYISAKEAKALPFRDDYIFDFDLDKTLICTIAVTCLPVIQLSEKDPSCCNNDDPSTAFGTSHEQHREY